MIKPSHSDLVVSITRSLLPIKGNIALRRLFDPCERKGFCSGTSVCCPI